MTIDDIRALTPGIRELAPQVEQDRRIGAGTVDRLAAAGVYRLSAPVAAGGREARPAELIPIFEELGYADGSTGWCAMISAVTGVILGRLPGDVAKRMLADPGFVIAGVAAPLGRAERARDEGAGRAGRKPDGLQVTGRWPYASGCEHATWLVGGVVIAEEKAVRHVVMPAAAVTIHDTWDVAGLRGTGSHDIEASDLFVPDDHVVDLTAAPHDPGTVFTFPIQSYLSFGIAAVALGIARAAIECYAETGKARPATIAEATAERDAAYAYLTAEMTTGGDDLDRRARMRLAITTATRSAARAVDLVYHAAGGAATYGKSPLQRHFRDIHTATQHALVGAEVLETAGAVLLGSTAAAPRL